MKKVLILLTLCLLNVSLFSQKKPKYTLYDLRIEEGDSLNITEESQPYFTYKNEIFLSPLNVFSPLGGSKAGYHLFAQKHFDKSRLGMNLISYYPNVHSQPFYRSNFTLLGSRSVLKSSFRKNKTIKLDNSGYDRDFVVNYPILRGVNLMMVYGLDYLPTTNDGKYQIDTNQTLIINPLNYIIGFNLEVFTATDLKIEIIDVRISTRFQFFFNFIKTFNVNYNGSIDPNIGVLRKMGYTYGFNHSTEIVKERSFFTIGLINKLMPQFKYYNTYSRHYSMLFVGLTYVLD